MGANLGGKSVFYRECRCLPLSAYPIKRRSEIMNTITPSARFSAAAYRSIVLAATLVVATLMLIDSAAAAQPTLKDVIEGGKGEGKETKETKDTKRVKRVHCSCQ